MRTRAKLRDKQRRLGIAFAVASGSMALALAASAASLGGIRTGDVFATSMTVSLSPSVPYLAYDSFAGCHAALEGWVDATGKVWASHQGEWQCLANEVARSKRRYAVGHATVDIGLYDHIEVSTFISRVFTHPGRGGADLSGPGLALFSDGEYFLSVVYKRDQDRVVIGATLPSGYRELVHEDAPADCDSMTLTVRIDQPYLTVLVDGSETMTLDLSDPTLLTDNEKMSLLGNTRFGLASDNDTWSTFDSFQVRSWP